MVIGQVAEVDHEFPWVFYFEPEHKIICGRCLGSDDILYWLDFLSIHSKCPEYQGKEEPTKMALCDGCHGEAPLGDLHQCDHPDCELTEKEVADGWVKQQLCNDCLNNHKEAGHKTRAVAQAEAAKEKAEAAKAKAEDKLTEAQQAEADALAKAEAEAKGKGKGK